MNKKNLDKNINNYNIIIISNENKIINKLSILFDSSKYNFNLFKDPLSALKEIKTKKYDLVIINSIFPEYLLIELLKKIKLYDPYIFTILITDHYNLSFTLNAIKNYDIQGYYDKSQNFKKLVVLVETIINSIYEFIRINLQLDNYSNQYKSPYLNTVQAIRNIAEYKDTYTIGHSFRVSKYSVLIGRFFKLSPSDLRILKVGSFFHDIGKISTPNNILIKNSKLNDYEYFIIKSHPLIGAHILSYSKTYSKIIPIVKFHHERYDGTGYPAKLRGEEIPFLTRIVTVADTFDAMTSKRTYRDALPLDVVISEFKRCRGTQFDPDVDDVFLNILENHYDEIEKIKNSY